MDDPRTRSTRDDGFALIEIMVALGIFLVVIMALLPQMVAGIRSVSLADREGVVKGLLQQEAERLRGLPYRVSLGTSGTGTDEDVDLLDLYYPNVSSLAPGALTCTDTGGLVLPTAAWSGYVTGGASARCGYEPSAGTFYRTVTTDTDDELGEIALVRDLQFLTAGSASAPTPAPVAPRGTYDSDHAVTNYPPSSQVGVTLTVLYRDRGELRARSLFTQISKHDAGPTLVTTNVDARAVEITSLAPDGAAESLSAGVVSLEGSVGDISSADVSLTGVVARVTTGDPTSSQFAYGATSTVAAPPSVATLTTVPDVPAWGEGGCSALLCFGDSSVGSDAGAGVLTDGGLPRAGSSTSPLRASVTDPDADALVFDNVGTATPTQNWKNGVVRLVGADPGTSTVTDPAACPRGSGANARLSGSGYLSTSLHDGSETVRDTAACAASRSASVGILPIGGWAPDGIVKVTLNRSFAWCTVTGGVPDGGTGLSATVEVTDGLGGYQGPVDAKDFDPTTAVIPLHGKVSDYLTGWTFDDGGYTPTASEVVAQVPGLQVTTKPTRYKGLLEEDENSEVVVTLGAVSCRSESSS